MLKYMAAIVFIHYAAKSMVFCFYKVTSTTTVAQLYKLPQTRWKNVTLEGWIFKWQAR